MLKRTLFYTTIVGVIAVGLAGCKNDPEQQRSVITVASINCNQPGLVDVFSQGDSVLAGNGSVYVIDDGIVETWSEVTFFNRPYSDLIITEPGKPHGDFVVTRYRIDWTRSDGGPVLPSRTENLSVIIPSDDFATIGIRLSSYQEKSNPILNDLNYLGTGGIIFMRANITFYGHETGSSRETAVQANLMIEFTDIVVTFGDEPDPCAS